MTGACFGVHLNTRLESHRIKVYGADEFIEMLDTLYPEFWLGIDADRFPYVRELRRRPRLADDVIRLSEVKDSAGSDSPLIDGNYLHLRLTRMEEEVTHKAKTTTLKRGETERPVNRR